MRCLRVRCNQAFDFVDCRWQSDSTPRNRLIAATRSITIWNVLALLVMLLGGGLTFLLAYNYKTQWAQTGQRLEFGSEYQIELAPEQSPVIFFYETASSEASSGDVVLTVYDPFGERITRLAAGSEDESFVIAGWHGYPTRELAVDEAGVYRIKCSNVAYSSDKEVPEDDRVVLLKQPPRTTQMLANHRIMLVVGASITMALAIAFYVVHGLTLNRRQDPA